MHSLFAVLKEKTLMNVSDYYKSMTVQANRLGTMVWISAYQSGHFIKMNVQTKTIYRKCSKQNDSTKHLTFYTHFI